MKATIEVKDRKEAEHIRAGLNDDAVRAFVTIMGALSAVQSQRAKLRIMTFVKDFFEEQEEKKNEASK